MYYGDSETRRDEMALSHNNLNTLQTILGKMEPQDFNVVNDIVRKAFSHAQLRAGGKFAIGDHVSWINKRGVVVTGKIRKINRKSVIVDAENGQAWRVSPSMLKLVG